MKRIALTVWTVCLWTTITCAQNPTADSLMLQWDKAEDAGARIGLMNRIIYEVPSLTQEQRITYTKTIRDLSKERGDKVMESVTTAELGHLLAYNGNSLQGTELAYAALEMAQHHDNVQALGIIYNDLGTCMEDSVKAFEYLHASLAASERAGRPVNGISSLINLAYLWAAGVRDSALYYAQRGYERSLVAKTNRDLLQAGSLWMLANIHEDMYGDRGIAREYMKKAMALPGALEQADEYGRAYITLARFHLADGHLDSAVYYADLVKGRLELLNPYGVVALYGLYKQIYDTTNANSALKYYRLAATAKADLDASKNSQQTALLQMKKEIELDQQGAARKQNLQFAFLAIGIIVLLLLVLLLSRGILTNTRVVHFLGVLALLIVFEFLNLLLHPFLEKVTDHSAVLMLLAMVTIASLLVPLHHRLENWATVKLVEKNKAIRLAMARQTIEKLEEKGGTLP